MSTGIEWTQETWNPTTGCDRISAGCDSCYALTMARRLKAMGQAKYQTDGDPRTSGPGFGLAVHDDALTLPYGWRQPRRVFVNSMSDLFHARVPLDFVRRVFAVMADTPQHTYQALTKRGSRLPKVAGSLDWPPNLWMGVSVEDASTVGRIDDLRQVPAAVRFLSLEPLIGPLGRLDLNGIDWAISGGESGPGARPSHPGWFRSVRDQCHAAGVAYFHKQNGAYAPVADQPRRGDAWVAEDGTTVLWDSDDGHTRVGVGEFRHGSTVLVRRVGKKAAGRELDGRTWDEYPTAAAVAP
jgi:protein gp37